MSTVEHLLIKLQQMINDKEQLQNKNRLVVNNAHFEGYRYLKENGFIAVTPVCCDYTQIRIYRLKYIQRIISAAYVTSEICDEYKDNIIELLKCVTLKTESSNYYEDFGIGTYTRVAELKVLIDEHFKRNKNVPHKLKPYPDYN